MLAVVLLGVGSYATVLVPQLMGQIVDLVIGNGAARPMWQIGTELILLSVAGAALSAAGFYLVARLSERVIANLRQDMVGTALGLPTHQVEDAGTGDLVSRSTDDVAELSAAVTETLPTLSTSLFSILATVVALLALDWYFVLIPVVVAPVYYVASRMYLARAPQRYAAERAAMAERARRVLEAIRGRATVRAFSMEDRMHTEIENASWSVVRKGITARTTMLVLNTWMLGIEFLMLTMALAVGYYLVSTDVLTVGAVTGAVLMIIRLRGPMNMLMRVLDVVQSGYASLARIVGVVSDPPVPVPDSGADAPRDASSCVTSASATATAGPSATSTSRSTRARPSPSSGPPAPARPLWRPCWPVCGCPTRARSSSTGIRCPSSPTANASPDSPRSARRCTSSPAPCART